MTVKNTALLVAGAALAWSGYLDRGARIFWGIVWIILAFVFEAFA